MNIIVQEGYKSNITLKKILDGINDSATEAVKYYSSETEINDNESIAVIIGIDKEWEKKTCCNLFNKQIHPIIIFPSGDISSLPYSFITTDDFYTFSHLTSMLIPYSKKGIVLAGFNPASSTDIIKLNGFRHGLESSGKDFRDEYVFESNDNISQCIRNLTEKKDSYDTIICVNDIIAILACSVLPDVRNYSIAGFNGMLCAGYTNPIITTIGIDYYALGYAVNETYNTLRKNSFMLKQSVYVKSKFVQGGTTPEFTEDSLYTFNIPESSEYNKQLKVYDDEVFIELDAIENLLQKSDEIDIKILSLLVQGKKYEEISGQLFLSITPLKYRINKMVKRISLNSKSEMVEMLRKYNIFVK